LEIVKNEKRKKHRDKVLSVFNLWSTMPWRRMGEWRYSSNIVDLYTKWRWVVSFTSRPLYPPVSIRWKVGWDRASLDPVKKSNPGHLAHSLLLYRLSYPGFAQILITQSKSMFKKWFFCPENSTMICKNINWFKRQFVRQFLGCLISLGKIVMAPMSLSYCILNTNMLNKSSYIGCIIKQVIIHWAPSQNI
jgi:hypothetical protein